MKETYDEMWRTGSGRIRSGAVECDERIDDADDSRLGLSLIFRIDATISDRFMEFMRDARDIEPDLYTYTRSQLHSTILSVVSCTDDFSVEPTSLGDYQAVVASCLEIPEPLLIDFRGVTASPTCVMAQGFPRGDGLDDLRNTLRAALRKSGLHQTIDHRYEIRTAHVTLVRFRQSLVDPLRFHEFVSKHRDTVFGIQRVMDIHFVLNDWYHTANKVRDLADFSLRTTRA